MFEAVRAANNRRLVWRENSGGRYGIHKRFTQLTYLRDYPEYLQKAAVWFSSKWGIPPESYLESMQACIEQPGGVPQWYVMLNARQEIAAGAGIIENDFHNRKDLSPNICALYVEPDYRRQGIAAFLLDRFGRDAGKLGFQCYTW